MCQPCAPRNLADKFSTLSASPTMRPRFHDYSPNSLSNFSQSTFSFFKGLDLAVASESLLTDNPTEDFLCAKLKHICWNTSLSSVRWSNDVDERWRTLKILFWQVPVNQYTLHQTRNQRDQGGFLHPAKSPPLEKCVEHSWKLLDIV